MQENYVYMMDDKKFLIRESVKSKVCSSNKYNFIFNKDNGNFARWGQTKEDNPEYSPVGPEILDLEISSGKCSGNCPFCYKSNSSTKEVVNMSFDQFKTIIDKFPKTLTQVAFGICDLDTNPDFFKMMEYSRSIGVIPNFTTNGIGLTKELAKIIVKLSGAVAVSAYEHSKDVCYDAIKMLTDSGLSQTNMHLMASKETLSFVYEVIKDISKDARLKNLNAVVFLGLKPKGRSIGQYHPLDRFEFAKLCELCFDKGLSFGFDSCSAPKFEWFVRDCSNLEEDKKKALIANSESCESNLFSSYVNVYGDYFPCSFCEGEGEWEIGVSVLNCKDFLEDIWYNSRVKSWRKDLLNSSCDGCRQCIVFPEIN